MTKNISITIEEDVLEYIDTLASSESRTRSAMINYLLTWIKDHDTREHIRQ